MADSKPIKYSQIAEPNLLEPLKKELLELNKLLGLTEEGLKSIVSEAAKIAKETPLTSFENLGKVEKGIRDTKTAVEELDKVEKDRLKLQQRIDELDDDRIKANFDLREQIRLQTKELRDNAKATKTAGDLYEKLKRDTNEAQKEFKKLAAEFGANSKQAEEARKTFNKFDEQLREVNDAARDGRRDVGRYEKGVKGLTKTFKVFASATVILKALELLQNSISQNSDGAAQLEKIWVRVTTVFSVVGQRIVAIFPAIQAKFERLVLAVQIGALQITNIFSDNGEKIEELEKQYEALGDVAGVKLKDAFAGLGSEIEDLTAKKVKLIDDTLRYRREIVALEQEVAGF
jgi:uncharacterized phage infection (PIP) family protein YhgE